jgi:flagellar biosynthesis chaperone FliJ
MKTRKNYDDFRTSAKLAQEIRSDKVRVVAELAEAQDRHASADSRSDKIAATKQIKQLEAQLESYGRHLNEAPPEPMSWDEAKQVLLKQAERVLAHSEKIIAEFQTEVQKNPLYAIEWRTTCLVAAIEDQREATNLISFLTERCEDMDDFFSKIEKHIADLTQQAHSDMISGVESSTNPIANVIRNTQKQARARLVIGHFEGGWVTQIHRTAVELEMAVKANEELNKI